MSTRLRRIASVIARVACLGLLSGALLGAATAALFAISVRRSPSFFAPVAGQVLELMLAGALVGGALGVLLGPVVGFGLLRQVRLGRIIAATAGGAFVGFALGLALFFIVLAPPRDTIWVEGVDWSLPLTLSAVGWLLGVLYVRWRPHGRAERRARGTHREAAAV